MRTTIRTADESTMRLLDAVVAFWLVLWLVIGVWSGITLWQASGAGDSITNSGNALRTAGEGLQGLGAVPVVGERSDKLGSEVVATADDISARGQEVKGELRRLALLLGVSIVGIPTTPVVGLYLPLRVSRRREIDELRRSLDASGRDPCLDRYLAERAIGSLPYHAVISVSSDPWGDIARGHVVPLADAELTRLGIARPRGE